MNNIIAGVSQNKIRIAITDFVLNIRDNIFGKQVVKEGQVSPINRQLYSLM